MVELRPHAVPHHHLHLDTQLPPSVVATAGDVSAVECQAVDAVADVVVVDSDADESAADSPAVVVAAVANKWIAKQSKKPCSVYDAIMVLITYIYCPLIYISNNNNNHFIYVTRSPVAHLAYHGPSLLSVHVGFDLNRLVA